MGSHTGKPELLAPAGGWSQLQAAVRFGADAVYLALDRFGMRARAENFALGDMPRVMEYCHSRGVKVSVALNTLMDDDDIEALPTYLEALARCGVDRLIVGDMGAFALARREAPEAELCVSTQASVMNAAAARQWYELGARRIVCAREMSLEAIARMRRQIPDDMQLEAFAHGAMCVAYSGRCLLSSVMTGRSGNKGACAQSCRWSYALVEEQRPGEFFPIQEDQQGTYVLNSQDLNMIAHLDAMAAAGIDSLKIEGRNKQAFYVATVVGAYRSVLDGGSVEAAQRELCTISHRPYGTGFYFGPAGQSVQRDGYIREWVHAATVEDCIPAGPGRWRATVLCHNRFAPDDVLETVSPGRPAQAFRPGPLLWHGPADGGRPFVERGPLTLDEVRGQSVLQPAPVANRSKEHYVFDCSCELHPGDFLRRGASGDVRFRHTGRGGARCVESERPPTHRGE